MDNYSQSTTSESNFYRSIVSNFSSIYSTHSSLHVYLFYVLHVCMCACVHNVGVMWLMKHSPVSLLHNAVLHCVCHSWQLLALSHVLDKHFMAHVVSFYCLWHHPKVAVLLKMWRNNELVNEWMRCVFYHTYKGGLKLLGGQKTIWFRLFFFFHNSEKSRSSPWS